MAIKRLFSIPLLSYAIENSDQMTHFLWSSLCGIQGQSRFLTKKETLLKMPGKICWLNKYKLSFLSPPQIIIHKKEAFKYPVSFRMPKLFHNLSKYFCVASGHHITKFYYTKISWWSMKLFGRPKKKLFFKTSEARLNSPQMLAPHYKIFESLLWKRY